MKPLKIITIVGTRPEIIRLSEVIHALEKSKSIDHLLIHTGQNYDYELNQIFFNDFGLKAPNYFLNAATGDPTETVGNILSKSSKLFKELKPDAVLILGDTNSCLSAYSAKRLKIPIFHMEAGNRCFDLRVPEEINRKIVDHISDINLTYSDISREYLLREGIPPDQIIRTGSPMKEVISKNLEQIKNSLILNQLDLIPRKYIVISLHREENIESENLKTFISAIEKLTEELGINAIISTHPRTRNKLKNLEIQLSDRIKLLEPLGYFDYNHLQMNSLIVLSDSGTVSEEASILGFRALNLREAHERPEAMEEGVVILTGASEENLIRSAKHIISTEEKPNLVKDYSYENVSFKVLNIILSYTEYINKKVWRK